MQQHVQQAGSRLHHCGISVKHLGRTVWVTTTKRACLASSSQQQGTFHIFVCWGYTDYPDSLWHSPAAYLLCAFPIVDLNCVPIVCCCVLLSGDDTAPG
jgi:hypothetical protein